MRSSRIALCTAVPALAAAAVLGAGAAAGGPAGGTLTLIELDRGSTFTHIRNTPTKNEASNQLGDLIAFTNPLADASGKVVGRLHADCVTTTGARAFRKSVLTCAGVLVLRDGTMTLQGTVSPGASSASGAITGGTGAYANARGVYVSADAGRDNVTTITFAP